jgi:hypothetical protein
MEAKNKWVQGHKEKGTVTNFVHTFLQLLCSGMRSEIALFYIINGKLCTSLTYNSHFNYVLCNLSWHNFKVGNLFALTEKHDAHGYH